MYYIGANGYYEGEKADFDDVEVPQRPSPYHEYNNGWVLSVAKVTESFKGYIQDYLDTEAKVLGYDNVLSACSYASAENPYQQEGISFVKWRGAVWAYCYQELAKVQQGTRPMPTIEEIISELPTRS